MDPGPIWQSDNYQPYALPPGPPWYLIVNRIFVVKSRFTDLKCDFTKLDLFRVEFLDSVSQPRWCWIYFAGVDIHTEISLEIETKYIAGSNAFDPKEKVEVKVSKRLSYFLGRSKKVGQKWYIFLYESL